MAEPGPIHPCAKRRHFKQHFGSLTGQLTGIETLRLPDDFGIRVDVFAEPKKPGTVFEVLKKSDAGSIRYHLCAFESNLEGWTFDAEEEDEEVEWFDV
jgi:hypothetical protein